MNNYHIAEVAGTLVALLLFYFWDRSLQRKLLNNLEPDLNEPVDWASRLNNTTSPQYVCGRPGHRYFKAYATHLPTGIERFIVADTCMDIAIPFAPCNAELVTGDYGYYLFDKEYETDPLHEHRIDKIIESSDYLSLAEAQEAGEV